MSTNSLVIRHFDKKLALVRHSKPGSVENELDQPLNVSLPFFIPIHSAIITDIRFQRLQRLQYLCHYFGPAIIILDAEISATKTVDLIAKSAIQVSACAVQQTLRSLYMKRPPSCVKPPALGVAIVENTL
jgi:hypothetical protein